MQPKYKKIISKNGHEMWYKDGRHVAWDAVPVDIRNEFNEIKATKCMFCDGYSFFTRYVSDQQVKLCENCYFGKTVGEIKEKLNELGRESKKDN